MVCFCASCAKVKVALNDIVAACGIVRWSSKWRYKWIVFCARKSLLVKVRQNLMDNTGFRNTATFGDTPAMDLSGRALGHWACAERFNVPGAAAPVGVGQAHTSGGLHQNSLLMHVIWRPTTGARYSAETGNRTTDRMLGTELQGPRRTWTRHSYRHVRPPRAQDRTRTPPVL